MHLVAHEVCELRHVRGKCCTPCCARCGGLSGGLSRMAARVTPMKGIRRRRWRAISLAMTIERERRRRAMKKARALVADRAPMGRHAQAPQFFALHRPAVYIRKYTVDVPPQ